MKTSHIVPLTDSDIRQQVVETARRCVGRSSYHYYTEGCSPPTMVNCVTLVRWALEQNGFPAPIATPQLLILLYELGHPAASAGGRPLPGDLVFICDPKSKHKLRSRKTGQEVSHVGLIAEKGNVIHACWRRKQVVEEPLDQFMRDPAYLLQFTALFSLHLTPQMVMYYLRGELSEAGRTYVDRHVDACDSCWAHYEIMRH